MTHHSILSYQERLASYLQQLAVARPAPDHDPADPSTLFRLSPGTDTGGIGTHHELLENVGRLAGVQTPCSK